MEATNCENCSDDSVVSHDNDVQNVIEHCKGSEVDSVIPEKTSVIVSENSEAMVVDSSNDSASFCQSITESTVTKPGNANCQTVSTVSNEQNIIDNNCNMEYKVRSDEENNSNNTSACNTEIMSADKGGNNVNANSENCDRIYASDSSVRNITVPSCSSAELAVGDLKTSAGNEVNGNAVNVIYGEITSESSVVAMVTEDSMENNETEKSNTDDQNSIIGSAERDSVVVDAMNKDQTWKSDAVYQKDLSSLQLLCNYGSDSDEDNNVTENDQIGKIESANESQTNTETSVKTPANQQSYRSGVETISDSDESDSSEDEDSSSSSSTATSSSSSEESEDSDNSSENECVIVEEKKPANEVPKTKGELGLDDLPPIEDLHIDVPESECVEIGKVLSIVDTLVVIQSIKGCPALDLDSVLFLDHGHNTLGQVFDVFGKVGEACYCVRFNSKDHAIQKGVEIGMPVYYAPRTEHSRFVFLADLMKMKGSDASWEHNNEPPSKFLDYSDDEEERRARKGDKPPYREVEPDESQPRVKKFNKRGPQRGRGGTLTSPRNGASSGRPWSTPFNRYPCPAPSVSPRSGPQPLIRPPSFQSPGPLESHFHNPAAGAPAVPATLSPWAVPPPAVSKEFNYNVNIANIPPPRPAFVQNQMRPRAFDMNVGGFGQPPPRPPPPPPPPSPSSRNFLMPTCIPGAGPFSPEALNVYRGESQNSFSHNQLQYQNNSFIPDPQQGPFRPQNPVFMKHNMPPPPPPHGW